ncbi:hypothetical protein ACGFIV_05510 [Sphaerisporangium sp. NPDC049003]|uniref:hypothetical protein n=1 Tax=Sphaerisporangium sp. NPDC049003 TaxID=3364517 RepID=UPI0037236108
MSADLELVRRGHPATTTVVTTRPGRRLSASVARRVAKSIPVSSRTARAWRWQTYADWCTQAGFVTDEPGAVPSFLAHLADRGHPVGTLRAFAGTLRAMLALDQAPLDAEDLKYCERVIVGRAQEIADDPTAKPGPLQADPVTPEDLRAMVRALPATARGIRDRALLLLDWWMAGRCSEPAALNLQDVVITTAGQEDWLCQVCGLGAPSEAVVLTRPGGRLVTSAVLHPRCAELALAVCPALAEKVVRATVPAAELLADGLPLSSAPKGVDRRHWQLTTKALTSATPLPPRQPGHQLPGHSPRDARPVDRPRPARLPTTAWRS